MADYPLNWDQFLKVFRLCKECQREYSIWYLIENHGICMDCNEREENGALGF